MGELKKWLKQDWVRIGTDGKIKGKCGTSKDKKNPDRCLPRSKAQSLTKSQRAATAKKKNLTAKEKARRKSFCARSAGQMKKFPKAAKNPNSRLRQARRRWRC